MSYSVGYSSAGYAPPLQTVPGSYMQLPSAGYYQAPATYVPSADYTSLAMAPTMLNGGYGQMSAMYANPAQPYEQRPVYAVPKTRGGPPKKKPCC
jgi:hypothetical protein